MTDPTPPTEPEDESAYTEDTGYLGNGDGSDIPTEPEDVVRNGIEQVLSTLRWAEAHVKGTNLQSDIIMLDRVMRPALAQLARERDDFERLYADAKAWVGDLQTGMYINCVYCGHRYGPDDEMPASMADTLKEHVERCPAHPMSALRAERDRLAEALENLAGDVYLYSLAGPCGGHEIAWAQVMVTQGEAIRALAFSTGHSPQVSVTGEDTDV